MNRRQTDKKYKRRFQIVYSGLFKKFLHVDVKPSRVHMRKLIHDDCVEIVGAARGYIFSMRFKGDETK